MTKVVPKKSRTLTVCQFTIMKILDKLPDSQLSCLIQHLRMPTYQADIERWAWFGFVAHIKESTLCTPHSQSICHVHLLTACLGKQHVLFQGFHHIWVHFHINIWKTHIDNSSECFNSLRILLITEHSFQYNPDISEYVQQLSQS